MKTRIRIVLVSMLLLSASWLSPQKAEAQVNVSFQVFYDDLSPYGSWVDNSNYGYVWVPNVAPGFQPYGSNGHWVYTEMGWTWVSNYAWGWAPFHYGRWFSDPVYGPMWVPGNEWGPGWVTWRSSAGYYGWAPIGPGISLEIAYSSGYRVANNQWMFVNEREFGSSRSSYTYVNNNTTIINNSTVINNAQTDRTSSVRYNAGPARSDVQKRSGASVSTVSLKESNKPGQNLRNNELQIYKPRIEKGQKSAPSKVSNLKDVQPASQRKAGGQPQKENSPVKNQASPSQKSDRPAKNSSSPMQKQDQPSRKQGVPQQRNEQPNKQQQPVPQQQKHNDQSAPEQQKHQEQNVPQMQKHNDQPAPQQQKHNDQTAPQQQRHNDQPAPQQQKHNDQPAQQQPKHNDQPVPQEQKHNNHSPKQ